MSDHIDTLEQLEAAEQRLHELWRHNLELREAQEGDE